MAWQKNEPFKEFGTILGGFIAFGILSFVHDSTILVDSAIIAMLLAFHLHQLIIKLEPH
jgi:surfactin synthase thioesterase subunit